MFVPMWIVWTVGVVATIAALRMLLSARSGSVMPDEDELVAERITRGTE